jgi:glutathione S-transferase
MLTLHQYHMSPYNEKIQRMLNVKGIAFEDKLWRIADRGKVLKLNPVGKLPALEHDGNMVCDSTDIAHYIESNFPDPPLIPAEPQLRGMVHVLEDWADESLYFTEMRLRFNTPGNQERNVARITAPEAAVPRWLMRRLFPRIIRKITQSQGVGRKSPPQFMQDTERHVTALAGLLTDSDWLVGGRLTLADLAVYAMVQCFRDADLSAALLDSHPAVLAWMSRVEAATGDRA